MLSDPSRPPRAGACVVCDTPVATAVLRMAVPFGVGPRGNTAVVCGQPACRSRVIALHPSTRCTVCARPVVTAWERLRAVCESTTCVAVLREREYGRQTELRRAALVDAATAWRDRVAVAAADVADDVPVVLIPSTDARAFPMRVVPTAPPPATRLPRRRVRAFRAHLRRIATSPAVEAPVAEPSIVEVSVVAASVAAVSVVTAPAVEKPAAAATSARTPMSVITLHEGALLGAACGACGGRCCRGGGDAAYLTPATLQRWMDDRPGARPADVIEAYAGHLPATSIRGSCVYHTTAGCALPRVMRSDTCNWFLCDGLKEFRQLYADRAAAGRPVQRAFVAVNESGWITRGQLSDAAATDTASITPRTPTAH